MQIEFGEQCFGFVILLSCRVIQRKFASLPTKSNFVYSGTSTSFWASLCPLCARHKSYPELQFILLIFSLWGICGDCRHWGGVFICKSKRSRPCHMGPILWGEGRTKDGHSLFQSDQGIFLDAYCRFSRFEQIRYQNASLVVNVMKIMMRLLMLKMLIVMVMVLFMMKMNMTLCSSLVWNVDHILSFSWWTSVNSISESKKIGTVNFFLQIRAISSIYSILINHHTMRQCSSFGLNPKLFEMQCSETI